MRAGSRLAARDGQVVIPNLEGAETAQLLSVRSSRESGFERTLCESPLILRVTRGTSWLQETRLEDEGIGGNSRRGIGGPELSLEPPRGLHGKELFTWSSEG